MEERRKRKKSRKLENPGGKSRGTEKGRKGRKRK